jgi:hypothetical protein
VIVDGFEERELDGLLERSARVRWNGGEFRMRFAVPPELAPKELDASPFMSTALLPAMAFHEDLVVDGPVSPLLLRQVDAIMRIYHGWAPGLRRCSVRVADERAGEPVKERLGSLFSRGVDSFFTALHPRPTGNPELLVFCSTFDPFEEETARAKQRSSARAAAAAIGLPLAEVRMNVRELTERIIDFGDLHGAALAALAQSTSGGLRHVIIPSAWGTSEFSAWGCNPLLDPLFSTETMRVEHDSVAFGRLDKTAWLASERPEVFALAEVCQANHTQGNCGRCEKCLITAVELLAVGAAGAIPGLPARPDPAAIRRMRPQPVGRRLQRLNLHGALGATPAHAELKAALAHSLRHTARPGASEWIRAAREWRGGLRTRLNPAYPLHGSVVASHWMNRLLEVLRYGPPPNRHAPHEPPGIAAPWESHEEERTGLLRGLDLGAHRHVYAVGAAPRGQLVGELGALERTEQPGTRPLWITADRRVSLAADPPERAAAPLRVRLRWAVAPLGWRESNARMRAATLGSRLIELSRRRQAPLAAPPGFEPRSPAGWIHAEPAPDRVPLYAAAHAATGDQLLTRDPGEAADMGFEPAELLGYLAADAPVTGRLAMQRLDVPWASRLGRHARDI